MVRSERQSKGNPHDSDGSGSKGADATAQQSQPKGTSSSTVSSLRQQLGLHSAGQYAASAKGMQVAEEAVRYVHLFFAILVTSWRPALHNEAQDQAC